MLLQTIKPFHKDFWNYLEIECSKEDLIVHSGMADQSERERTGKKMGKGLPGI